MWESVCVCVYVYGGGGCVSTTHSLPTVSQPGHSKADDEVYLTQPNLSACRSLYITRRSSTGSDSGSGGGGKRVGDGRKNEKKERIVACSDANTPSCAHPSTDYPCTRIYYYISFLLYVTNHWLWCIVVFHHKKNKKKKKNNLTKNKHI